jgi:hypothetical protein
MRQGGMKQRPVFIGHRAAVSQSADLKAMEHIAIDRACEEFSHLQRRRRPGRRVVIIVQQTQDKFIVAPPELTPHAACRDDEHDKGNRK